MTPALAAPSILATLPIYEDAVSDLRVVTSSVTDQSADQIRTLLANQIELGVFLDRLSPFGVNVSSLLGGVGVSKKNKVKID